MFDDSEKRTDGMLAAGLQVMREAIDRYQPIAIVAAFSSGDDSIVSTHFTMANFPETFVFNADTLTGLAPSRCHLREVCERFQWRLEIEEAYAEGPPQRMHQDGKLVPFDPAILPAGKWVEGDTAYEEYCLNHGFPGRNKYQHARMYQRLKERPFRRLLKRLGASKAGAKVLIVSGIRGDESAIRAGYKRTTAEGYFGDVWVNPFYYQSAADFEAYRQEFGLPRNPAKRLCGISGECCCGTFSNTNERAGYRAVDPAFADYLDRLESRVKANGFPWGWGESPPAWWTAARVDKKRGQLSLFEDLNDGFQPMCVGCNNGRR
jgi:3'-phosphoadenosine 5'-phosphosulfate sulfotransferase (PAPS reductase)/FAD synthetase